MYVNGVSFICGGGVGVEAVFEFLNTGKALPQTLSDTIIDDYPLPPSMRRAGRFARLSVIAAMELLKDSPLKQLPQNTATIVVTALGAHRMSFAFLDDLLDYNENEVSPITFSNSVHNAAASYINSVMNTHGPSYTFAGFDNIFKSGLLAARTIIESDTSDSVVLIGVDEHQFLDDLTAEELGINNPLEAAAGLLLGSKCLAGGCPFDKLNMASKIDGKFLFGDVIDYLVEISHSRLKK